MIPRPPWSDRVEASWRAAPIAWLAGVRRSGKTTLARSFADARYLNCDLPSTADLLRDPERFLASVSEPILVLDEVHQLPDPSRVLKIAADAFPGLRVLATGSSTLAATQKFKDSLTGRKRVVTLLPVLVRELPAFGVADLTVRLLRGGLPPALLAERRDPDLYAEWMDSFYARDVQELFRVEKRRGFLLLLEALLRQSGGLAEVTSLCKTSGLSRPTVVSYLDVLEVTQAIHVLRPFHGGGRQELVRQPKVYGFDTGFVCHARGIEELRATDCGSLFEHVVLDELLFTAPGRVHFWRDKAGREVDFVVPRGRDACDAFEVKWHADAFESRGLLGFRALYPAGRNVVVSPQLAEPYVAVRDGLEITFARAQDLSRLASEP